MAETWFNKAYEILFVKSKNEDIIAYHNLPLLGSWFSIILLDLTYMIFVLKLGPWLMRNRQPFELRKCLMIYNGIQVLANSFLMIVGGYYFFFTDLFDLGCIHKLPIGHREKPIEVAVFYLAYLTKLLDWMDTIFFVLRKSYRQITFLHVYHHAIVATFTYAYIRYYGFGGHSICGGYFNAIVHVFMYTYYFASASRPDLKKSLWWKRHLTELQIVQFIIILIHQSWPLVVHKNCNYPKIWLYMFVFQSILFLYLFGKFYKNTYLSKKKLEVHVKQKKLVDKGM